MIRAAALLATLLFLACDGGTSLPAPEILSVTPNRLTLPQGAPAADKRTVRISLDAVLAVHVDYGSEQVRTEAARVWIGGEEAVVERQDPDGTLTVVVPGSLGEGTYDVRVALSDGREAERASVLTLVPAGSRAGADAGVRILPDGGTPPDGDATRLGAVTGFQLDAVEDQQRGVPFRLIIRALGPRASSFTGTVELTVNKRNGGVSPTRLGPFIGGAYTQRVTVTAHGGNVKLTVTDASGAQGTTNGFKVRK